MCQTDYGWMTLIMDLAPRNEVRECAVYSIVIHGDEGDGRALVSWIDGQSTYLMTIYFI